MDDKTFKICNVLGGLDVMRYVSSNTRLLFRQAIEDVELIRESVSQAAALDRIQQEQSSENLLDETSRTFQWKERGYKKETTSLEAGFGFSDDTPGRVVDTYVSPTGQTVCDKETDLRIIQSVRSIFPWIVDRRSIERDWWVPHQNGRSEGNEKEAFLFDSLYTAAWIGTFGESWIYYPPFWVFGDGKPKMVGQNLGGNLTSHDFPFVKPNLPWNNPNRTALLREPYPDVARPGLSLITALAPVYFTGTFDNCVYNDTYIASTGVDIDVNSVSTLLDVLLDKMTNLSFAMLVDLKFHTIVISQTVVERIYPERTGSEDERITYDRTTGKILSDRRNKTYLVSDTLFEALTQLKNADWSSLLNEVKAHRRGDRDFSLINITLTGETTPKEFYVMYERWRTQADWVVMAFAPTHDVNHAIDVSFDLGHSQNSSIHMSGEKGIGLVDHVALINHGHLDVKVTANSIPTWLQIHPVIPAKHTLYAGDVLSLRLEVTTTGLELGTSSISLSFTIQDDEYPDCFYNQDIILPLVVKVFPKDCVALTGDRLRIPDRNGVCICAGSAFELGAKCWSQLLLILVLLTPLIFVGATILHYYIEHKKQQADSIWAIKACDLIFDDPPEVAGRGTFGLVVLAEYRGTRVAVKRAIPPKVQGVETKEASRLTAIGFLSNRESKRKSQGRNSNELFDFRDEDDEQSESKNEQKSSSSFYSKLQRKGSGGYFTLHQQQEQQNKSQESKRKLEEESEYVIEAAELASGQIKRGPGPNGYYVSYASRSRSTSRSGVFDSEKLKADFIAEMRVLSKLRHPCITTVMGAVIARHEEPLLVMEYMDHGSLFDILQNETVLIEGHMVLSILRDISQGLRFLHAASPQVIHGDLKAQNVLVDSKFRAKVADFGLSQKKQVGACGTPLWMAPELLRGASKITSASDVYSFGIVLYEVYARKMPYEDEEIPDGDLFALICDSYINKRPEVPSSMPADVAKLMAECLDGDPMYRPTFQDIDLRLKEFKVDNVEPERVTYSMQLKKQMDAATKLLNEIFPKHIAEALSSGRRVEPEHFDCVTIFFSDIVGFTTIASEMLPLKVSDMLDRLYFKFDSLSKRHDVFKVETIGDAWMGVTNLAKSQKDHAKRIAKFAVDAIRVAASTLIDEESPERGHVRLRVGFHSGPVVANVVGTASPRYTLIGDTVNTASRMESNSAPGKILCSDRAAKLIMEQAPEIPLTYRGKIDVKGKGDMDTFWVSTDIWRNDFESGTSLDLTLMAERYRNHISKSEPCTATFASNNKTHERISSMEIAHEDDIVTEEASEFTPLMGVSRAT